MTGSGSRPSFRTLSAYADPVSSPTIAADALLPIAAVSDLLDIPIPTIRSWERRYGFPTPPRTQGKHRRYTLVEADQLRMLRDEIARGHSTREAVDLVRAATTVAGPRHELFDCFLQNAMRLDPDRVKRSTQ